MLETEIFTCPSCHKQYAVKYEAEDSPDGPYVRIDWFEVCCADMPDYGNILEQIYDTERWRTKYGLAE